MCIQDKTSAGWMCRMSASLLSHRCHDAAPGLKGESAGVLPRLATERVDLAGRGANDQLQLPVCVDVAHCRTLQADTIKRSQTEHVGATDAIRHVSCMTQVVQPEPTMLSVTD